MTPCSPAQIEAVGAWMRETMDLLQLRDWSLLVMPDPPEGADGEEAWATVTCTPYRQSELRVSADLLRCHASVIERALVHEIVHMYHADMMEAVWEVADKAEPGCFDIGQLVLVRYVERMVDQVARVLVEHVDLPPVTAMSTAEPTAEPAPIPST